MNEKETVIIQKQLEVEEISILENRGRIAVFYMAVPLIIGFNLIDWVYAPENALIFLYVRLTVIPVAVIYNQLDKFKKLSGIFKMHFFTTYIGLYTSYLVMHTGYEKSLYYAGLNLVAIGSICFLPWRKFNLFISILSIFLPYYVAVIFFNPRTLVLEYFLTNNAFIVGTIFLSVVVWFLTMELRKKEFLSRLELKNLIQNQEKIIIEKTNESVYLNRLTRQFSDGVVALLKSGLVNLEARERRFVSCIFIDIENSSEKANRLDYKEYLDICDDFFQSCTEIFKENNITVGAYLGDGVIAFANAPTNVENHESLTFKASLEVLNARQRLNRNFKNRWGSDFNIRIGLNSGYAVAGFFPAGARGNYSVNGPSVNLASRLCSVAPSNSITVTKEFFEKANLSKFASLFESSENNLSLKGFGPQTLELVFLKPSATNAGSLCPLCGGSTYMSTIKNNLDTLSCADCTYVDLREDVIKKIS